MLPWWVGGPVVAAAGAVLGLATGLNATGFAALSVLGVIAAALLSGRRGGLAASVLSFLALNYFFTAPRRTFVVDKTEDLVALGVFLVVSLVVSHLFTRVEAERQRAELREREVGALYEVAEGLLAGAPLEATLGEIAGALVSVFGLTGADIRVTPGSDGAPAVAASKGSAEGTPVQVSLGRELGTVLLYPGDRRIDDDTLGLAEAFVSQAALAVERAGLDRQARLAHLEMEAAGIRAALFSAVTHDLKTPLASVKAAVTSLLDTGVGLSAEDRQALLETILAEADRLGRLLANLLDLARLKANALEPRTEPTDLAELVGAVLRRLRPALDGHDVEVALRDDLPEVSVDVVQIDQVLTNLLENAARFSPPGAPIRITASRWQSGVEVRVSDRGPGIPVEDRERAFESFWRQDRGPGRSGSGLGLTISRAIVVAHRGRMRLEETPGGGTTVVFSLPVEPGRPAETAELGEAR